MLKTYATIVMAIIEAVQIRKRGGLNLKSQVMLGLSASPDVSKNMADGGS